MWVALGLGSNVGDRKHHLESAVDMLSDVLEQATTSPIYETTALLPEGAPKEWNRSFLNMVIAGNTTLSPAFLLDYVKELEVQLGRQVRGVWGPREIDIDILAYGDAVIDTPELKIPHPHLLSRDFALKPLSDVAPAWVYPTGAHQGKTAKQLVRELGFLEHEGFKYFHAA